MIEERVQDFINAPMDSINLGDIQNLNLNNSVQLFWGDEPVGLLKKGENIFSPIVESFNFEFIDNVQKQKIIHKLMLIQEIIYI